MLFLFFFLIYQNYFNFFKTLFLKPLSYNYFILFLPLIRKSRDKDAIRLDEHVNFIWFLVILNFSHMLTVNLNQTNPMVLLTSFTLHHVQLYSTN